MKNSFKRPMMIYSTLFYTSIILITLISMFLIIKEIGIYYIEFIDISHPSEMYSHIIFKLPIIASLVWIALSASKRRSENHRLWQEYAHKEANVKSFENFKNQIEILKPQNNELLEKLLDKLISTVSFNASATLDKKHGDKLPVADIVEKAVDKIMSKNSNS